MSFDEFIQNCNISHSLGCIQKHVEQSNGPACIIQALLYEPNIVRYRSNLFILMILLLNILEWVQHHHSSNRLRNHPKCPWFNGHDIGQFVQWCVKPHIGNEGIHDRRIWLKRKPTLSFTGCIIDSHNSCCHFTFGFLSHWHGDRYVSVQQVCVLCQYCKIQTYQTMHAWELREKTIVCF